MSDETDILDFLQHGGRLSSPMNAPPRYRAELLRIMASFVDSTLAGAAGFADRINDGPGIKERIAASRIVLEKLDHAERVLRLMAEFGADAARYQTVHPWAARIGRDDDIGAVRQGGDMRLNVFRYPLSGWTDAVVLNAMMGAASVVQLADLAECSYQPLGDAIAAILPREARHAELGAEGFHKLAAGGEAARAAIDASMNYWWPRVSATFGAPQSPRTATLRKFGLRRRDNADLADQWRIRMNVLVGDALKSWGGRT